MATFQHKPIIVDAEQWFLDSKIEEVEKRATYGYLRTLWRRYIVLPGDWIVTSKAGKKSVCKAGVFEAVYELIEEEADGLEGISR